MPKAARGQRGLAPTQLTSNHAGTSATSLNGLEGIALDATRSIRADQGNNRVLYYARGSTRASVVYASPHDQQRARRRRHGLYVPRGVRCRQRRLYVADTGNNRVLYYAKGSTTASGSTPTQLGQQW